MTRPQTGNCADSVSLEGIRSWPKDLLRALVGGLSGTGRSTTPLGACHSAEAVAGGDGEDAPRAAVVIGAPASCQVVPLHSFSVML